jgi:hypothetical protein
MAERPNHELSGDIYESAVERLEGLTKGEFFYGPIKGARRIRLQLTPRLNATGTTSQEKPVLGINLNPETPSQTEYTVDPSNLSVVERYAARKHLENPGIWRRLLRRRPRLEANQDELKTLTINTSNTNTTELFKKFLEEDHEVNVDID